MVWGGGGGGGSKVQNTGGGGQTFYWLYTDQIITFLTLNSGHIAKLRIDLKSKL